MLGSKKQSGSAMENSKVEKDIFAQINNSFLIQFVVSVILIAIISVLLYMYIYKQARHGEFGERAIQPSVVIVDECREVKGYVAESLNLNYSLPKAASEESSLPSELMDMFDENILQQGKLYNLNCNGSRAYLLVYGYKKVGSERGTLKLVDTKKVVALVPTYENALRRKAKVETYSWRDEEGKDTDWNQVRISLMEEGLYELIWVFITREHFLDDFEDIFTQIVKSTDYINRKTTLAEKNNKYTNSRYGFSVDFPKEISVKEMAAEYCDEEECMGLREVGDIAKLGSIYVEAFKSSEYLENAYDIGFRSAEYKKPKKIIIGGIEYYMIINKKSGVEILAHSYKYHSNILWVKSRRRVTGSQGTYYISFSRGLPSNEVTEDDVGLLEGVLENFAY